MSSGWGGSGGRFSEDVPREGTKMEFVAGFPEFPGCPGNGTRGAVGGPIPSRAGGQDDVIS
eukprot:8544620-Pyramimonas_sp.AAC.1